MLIRNRQIAAKVEDIEGTAESLAAADAKYLIYEPRTNPEAEMQERSPVRGNLSKLSKLAGMKSSRVAFRLELRGSGTATTAPAWAVLLRACGFRQHTVRKLTIGAISGGPFLHGEQIVQSTSNAKGRVIMDTADGTTTLYFYEETGTPTWDGTNGITGQTSGATATPSAVADAGIGWHPFSHELSQVTIGSITSGPYQAGEIITGGTSGAKGEVYEETADGVTTLRYRVIPGTGAFQNGETVTGGTSGASATTSSAATQSEVPSLTIGSQDDLIRKVMKGARGTVKFNARVGEAVFLDFEFMGAQDSVTDQPQFSGVTQETTKPPLFLDASLSIDSFAAILSSLDVDIQANVARRVDANATNGILSYRITGRDPVGSMDPEMVQVTAHDFFGKWFANTEMVLDFTIGSVAGNTFRFYAKRAQYNGIEDQDRDGIAVGQASFDLNGDPDLGDDELWILHL